MNTSLAIRKQASGKRKRWVQTMKHLLDNDPRILVIEDDKQNLWEGAKKTLQSYQKWHNHVLVLQDDILLSAAFIRAVEAILELLPDKLITFFSNRDEILQARAEGKLWALLNRLLMAQAYVMPTPMIEDFLLFAEKHIKPEIYFDDNRITVWMLKNNIKAWATAPSLVQHLCWDSTTLRGGYKEGHRFDPKQRMASWFLGFERSGLEVDWTKGLDKPIKDRSEGDWAGVCQYYIE